MRMYEIFADGIGWVDSDGNTEWNHSEACSLADMIENKLGYKIVMVVRV
jgi:hypothetical protein